MNQEDSFTQNIQDEKPLNINISFNINRKQVTQNLLSNQRTKKSQQDKSSKKPNGSSDKLNQNQHAYKAPKTPQLSMTDRNVYSKQIQYMRPTEELKRKKKIKRNSADYTISNINQTQGFIGQVDNFSYHKRGITSTLIKRPGPYKSKRTNSKLQADSSKRSNVQKSVDYSHNQIKGPIQKSLKSMINKIIKNQLSKRSLPSSSINKTKTNISNSLTSRKKPSKKKSKISFSKQLPQRQQVFNRKQIIQKLGSLRSVQNSVMVSQVNEQDEIRKSKRTIVIKTDHSMDCLDQIHNFQRNKFNQDFFQQDSKNISQTKKLIENYVKLFNESQTVQNIQSNYDLNQMNMEESQNYLKQSDYAKVQKLLRDSINQDGQSPIRRIQNKKQQLQILGLQEVIDTSSDEEVQLQQRSISKESEKLQNIKSVQNQVEDRNKQYISIQIKKEVGITQSQKKKPLNQYDEQSEQLRPFISSQIGRGKSSNNNQRIKLNELKKQQIQKWGYLLEFIKQNMSKGKTNTQEILTQVYGFLEKAKVDLQKQVSGQNKTFKNNDSKQLQEFTVKLSSQFQRSQLQNQQSRDLQVEQEQEKDKNHQQIDEDVLSFKQEYEQQNETFKMMNLQTIQQALKNRFKHLNDRKSKQILLLQQKKQLGKISNSQFLQEKEKIQKWIKQQTNQILKAKKNIWKGYNEAKGILDKTANSQYFQEYQTSNSKKMMKCLSESYLNKKSVDYKKILLKKKEDEQSSQQQENQENYDSQGAEQQYNLEEEDVGSLKSDQAIDKINEKVIKMKQKAEKDEFNEIEYNQNSPQQVSQKNISLSPCVSYEQVQKQLNSEQYSDEQYKLINEQIKFSSSRPPLIQKNNNRFKYLTSQDKEDIFEFLFLDLCIQLYQQPCKQNKFMDAINAYIDKLKAQSKKKKGVKTNLNVVKDYLKRFCGFILRTNKQALQNLNVPMGPTAIQMLRYMHQNQSEDDYRDDQEGLVTLIVPMMIFDKFQKTLLPTLQFEKYYDDEQKENQRIQFLKNILHIHNKALYDALNQYLDQQRPFGIWGKPFPWKKSSSFSRKFTQLQLQEKLKKSAQKVVETCSYVCGLLVDKQQSLVGNAKLSEAYIQQIKQDRISRMLANDMIENQQRWVFYDDQQTQVLVQAGNTIFNRLLIQVCNEALLLKNRKIQIQAI